MSEKVKIVVSADCHDFATTQGMHAFRYANTRFIERGYELVLLECDKAVREKVVPALEGASFFYGVGHGNEDVFTGWNLDRIFWTCDSKALSGKLSYLLSCSTGKRLGYDIIEKNGISYIGYAVDFTWMVKDENQLDPLKDEYAKWFFTPIVELLTVLASGGRMIDAHQRAYDEFTKGIEYWRESDDPYAFWVVYFLTHDRDGQVLYGDPEARIPTRPTKVLTSSIELSFSTELTVGRIEAPTLVARRPSLVAPLVMAIPVISEELRKEERIVLSLFSLATLLKYITARPPAPPRPIPPPEVKLVSSASISIADRGDVTPSVRIESSVSIVYHDAGSVAIPTPVRGEDSFSTSVDSTFSWYQAVRGADTLHLSLSTSIVKLFERVSSISVSFTDVGAVTASRVIRSNVNQSYSDSATVGKIVLVIGHDSLLANTTSILRKEFVRLSSSVSIQLQDVASVRATRRFTSSVGVSYIDVPTVVVSRRITSSVGVLLSDSGRIGKTVSVNGYDFLSISSVSTLRKVEVRLTGSITLSLYDTVSVNVLRRLSSSVTASYFDSYIMWTTRGVSGHDTLSLSASSSASRA